MTMSTSLQSDDSPETVTAKLDEWGDERDVPETIVGYLRRETKRKPKSAPVRQSRLQNYAEWLNSVGLKPENATHKQVSEFLWSLEREGYANSTVKDHYRVLRHYYNYLEDWEEIIDEDNNPFEPLSSSDFGEEDTQKERERRKHKKYVSYDEKEMLKEHAPPPKLRNVLLIELLWQTGIRKEETSEIELSDVDREERSIWIWGKGSKDRTVFYRPSLDSLLDPYLNHARAEFFPAEKSKYLFVSQKSEQLSPSRISEIIREAADNAGILEELPPDVNGRSRWWPSTHRLRNGHAIEALRSSDITLRDLQLQLGHHSLEETEKYLQMLPEDRRKAYQSFGAHRSD